MRRQELARIIDHTALGPTVGVKRIEELCREATLYGFAAVCIPPTHVSLAVRLLQDEIPAVCTVVGFPHGQHSPEVKAFEARAAVGEGAREVDMVINVAALKEGDYAAVQADVRAVRESLDKVGERPLLKVILECALLDDKEKTAGAILAQAAGADFVKTSTGYGPGGATVEDVALLRRVVAPHVGVKAAGGISDYAAALRLVEAGANRLGASRSISIVEGATD